MQPRYYALANMFADRSGLSVEIDKRTETPCTAGNVIMMPPIPEEENKVVWWFYAFIHECLHQTGWNKQDLLKIVEEQIDMRSPFGHVLNIVADHNIEHGGWGEYVGRDKYLKQGRALHYEHAEPIDPAEAVNGMAAKMQAIWVWDTRIRDTWSRHGHVYHVHPNVERLVDALSPLTEEYRAVREGGDPNIEMTKRIWDILDREEPPTEEEQQSMEGEGGGEDRMQEAKDLAAEAKEMAEAMKKAIEEAMKRLPHHHSKEAMEGEGEVVQYEAPPEMDITYEGGSYIPVTEHEVKLDGEPRKVNAHLLAKQVANLLRTKAAVRRQGGHKRGKLHSRSLTRSHIQTRAGNGHMAAPFYVRTQKDVMDTAVTVLVDMSGSMNGTKYECAVEAAGQLAACLDSIHIPYSVLGFTQEFHGAERVKHLIVKGFNDSFGPDKVVGNMHRVELENNLDGQALLWAHDQLLHQKNNRKVLIVLSDGQPSGACSYNEDKHLMDVCREIDRHSPIELYAVGICTDAPRRYYNNYQLLDNPRDIERTVINLIKKSIIGE
jgi:hypothetical protein